MAKFPDTPQQIGIFDLEPAPNCPHCANKVMQVRVDGVLTTGAIKRADGDQVIVDVSLTGRALTALPCGCLLDGAPEGGD